MKNVIPSTVYGPVKSWRLGYSLGVDLLCIDSICSFECVYCQLGKINLVTDKRDIFVPTEKVISDFVNSSWPDADHITFSGSGEPTLAKNLGEVIDIVKNISHKPIVVLTNSSLLDDSRVRSDLMNADKVFCKLDAWDDDMLERIDRPHPGVSLKSILSGLYRFRKEFRGFMALQTMILRKPKNFEINRFADIICALGPDEVQLNLPLRPIPKEFELETRGNLNAPKIGYSRLKSIENDELECLRNRLEAATGLRIVTRYNSQLGEDEVLA